MRYGITMLKAIPADELDKFLESLLRFGFGVWAGRRNHLSNKAGWCEECGAGGDIKNRIAHHVVPVKKRVDCTSWDEFIELMFSTNLQSLCKKCHMKIHARIRRAKSKK